MAIYHLSVKPISRADGRSATAAAGVSVGGEHPRSDHRPDLRLHPEEGSRAFGRCGPSASREAKDAARRQRVPRRSIKTRERI